MRNIKLLVAYDGSRYHGWERQKQEPTVQQTLEEALGALTGEQARVFASGRTDAGVHALGQVLNFHTRSRHSPETFVRALNAHLPDDVVVRAAEEVASEFHANYDTLRKLYRYVIYDGPTPDPFTRRYAYHSRVHLDTGAMHCCAQALRGTHDFHSFETEWPNRSTSVRTVTYIAAGRAPQWQLWESCTLPGGQNDPKSPGAPEPHFIFLDVQADGFLYNMVRAIAGTLINVGRGFWPQSKVAEVLEAEDRRAAGPTAPAHALFLVRVDY
jgi:tRNA pseudouridine38-40 synthase